MAVRRLAFNVALLTFALALQTIASIVAILVLARLWEPSEFGMVALAMPIVLFVIAIADAVLGQSVRVDPKQMRVWSSAFWFILMIGAGLALFMLALTRPMAWPFEEPLLSPLIATLALIPLIQVALEGALVSVLIELAIFAAMAWSARTLKSDIALLRSLLTRSDEGAVIAAD